MNKNNPNLRALKMLVSYNKRHFPLYFVYQLFVQISPYYNLWISAEIITALYENAGSRKVWILVIAALAGNLLISVLNAVMRRIVQHEETILSQNEKCAFLAKTLSLDYDKLENPAIRTLRRTIKENAYIDANGVKRLRWAVESLITVGINFIFSLIFFCDMLSHILSAPFQPLSVVCLAGIVLLLISIVLYNFYTQKKIADYRREINRTMLDENRIDRGMPGHNRDIRLYRQDIYGEKVEKKYFQATKKAFSDAFMKEFLYSPVDFVMRYGLRALAYLLVCMYCSANVFPIGSVIKYVGYLNNFIGQVTNLFANINSIRANTPYIETYLSFFDIPNDMYQGSLTTEKRSDRRYNVEFRNVSFKYPGCEEYAIRNLSIKFNISSRLAVVGKNGSGKTTFIKLLCRLYDPTEGEILLNGINIRKYDYRDYLSIFSVVFQDFNLFSFPLAQNVSASREYDAERVKECLTEAGFGERLSTMPDGIETPLYKDFDENGVEVSGGEAQKIALARALYKNTPFIILDEPTAALDPIAEAEIYSKFNDIVGDRTAIYISHRLSSCRFCDEIAVFDQGNVVQMGSHDTLVETDGLYRELWYAQAQYYEKNG